MFAPDKNRPPGFDVWCEREDDRIYMSIVSLHEIAKGITELKARGATHKASDLQTWFDQTITDFEESILGYDKDTALLAGDLEGLVKSAGNNPGMGDAMIAAISREHDLIVITNNVKHFEPFEAHGVIVMTPENVVAAAAHRHRATSVKAATKKRTRYLKKPHP